VENFGSSFMIRPWNYFNQLASRTVYDVPIANVAECGAPLQGIVNGYTPPAPAVANSAAQGG